MLPPDERLSADHLAAREIEHRLVEDLQLSGGQRLGQFRDGGASGDAAVQHVFGEYRHATFPRGLAAEQGQVRIPHERVGFRVVLLGEGDAHARREAQGHVVDHDGSRQDRSQPIREGGGIPGPVQSGEQQQELVAPILAALSPSRVMERSRSATWSIALSPTW